MAWGFQAHVRKYAFELLGFTHKKISFLEVSAFLASYELPTIFLSCQKVSRPKRNFKYALWCFCGDNSTRMKTFPNFKHVFLIPKPSVKFWFISQPNTHIFEKFLCKELVCLSKKIWKYLSKPIIETEK